MDIRSVTFGQQASALEPPMPELTLQERLQPALLDRLTDDEPGKSHEAPERRVISKSRLRRAVLRDLAWLFNATKPSSLGLGPHVRRSVVSGRLPALGRAASLST